VTGGPSADRGILSIGIARGPSDLKFGPVGADGEDMVFDVLVVMAVAATIWWWQRRRPVQARHARSRDDHLLLLPYEDLPPIGAFEPVPDESDLDDYITEGVQRLSHYLSGRDQTL
jgi:hypothetical protein